MRWAHALSSRLRPRRQVVVYLLLMLGAAAFLPMTVGRAELGPASPGAAIPRLLAVLALSVGPPFLVLAAISPLLQSWFAASGHRRGADPYFLYAASNAGSLLALVGYVAWVEPTFPLAAQARLWAVGYAALIVLTAACGAVAAWRPRPAAARAAAHGGAGSIEVGDEDAPEGGRPASWVFLAFVPSALMLAVTTFLSAEIAPVPLLWVAPLALYLVSFMIAFAGLPGWAHGVLRVLGPVAVAAEVPMVLDPLGDNPRVRVVGHLVAFLVIATACHAALARRRPPARRLTAFYLWIAVGGVLGGVLNAIVAPLVFDRFLELPLVLALAAGGVALGAAGRRGSGPLPRWLAAGLVVGLALVPAAVTAGVLRTPSTAVLTMRLLPAAALCLLAAWRPVGFAAAVAGMLAVGTLLLDADRHVATRERNFFGMLTVRSAPGPDGRAGGANVLTHGNTLHGLQARSGDPLARRTPRLYYHPSGPIGQVMSAYRGSGRLDRVGVVGLGIGSLAAYGEPGQDYTFFEINPAVVRIATGGDFFSHLRDCEATWRVVPGDARQSLARDRSTRFGLLVVDAFSGDAIPVHLLTVEALRLDAEHLAPGGLLALHISNRYLDLEPTVAATARAAGLVGVSRREVLEELTAAERTQGKTPSHWIVLARDRADLAPLEQGGWRPLRERRDVRAWTDDFSDLIRAVRW